MSFTAPIPFAEALQSRDVRSVLPTSLGSADLADINLTSATLDSFSMIP